MKFVTSFVTSLVTSCKSFILYLCNQCNHYMYVHTHESRGNIYFRPPLLTGYNWLLVTTLGARLPRGSDKTKGGVCHKRHTPDSIRASLKRIGPRAILTNLRYRIPYSVRNLSAKSFGVSAGLMVSCHRLRASMYRGCSGWSVEWTSTLLHHASMVEAPTIHQLGGRARASRLPAERRREIAIAASRAALLRHRGMYTTRELTRAYIARLRAEDPDLARFVALALQAPAKYADGLAAVLPPDQIEVATRNFEVTWFAHLSEAKQ